MRRGSIWRRRISGSVIALAAVAVAAGNVWAQAQPSPNQGADLNARQNQLHGVENQLKGSEDQQRQIQSEIESIRADRERLTAALLDVTSKTKANEEQAAQVEQRLQNALASEDAIRKSLDRRRGLIAQVLAVLQRMGRKPPPAVLVDPADMLKAIRTSMLLGSILPEMRQEIDSLAVDLADLAHAREAVASEKVTLATDLAGLAKQRIDLAALIDQRQKAQDVEQKTLGDEAVRSRQLALQARDLKDLITRMESEQPASGPAGGQLAGLPHSGNLSPSKPFTQRRGALALPVAGSIVKPYGAPDGFGGIETGLSVATVSGAVVTAPADSWVAYSGPYRTYGQLLILNAGEGYYIVMAGMEKINVEVGQFVVAGEPVALMGDGSTKTAATIAVGAAQPVLYLEFRKNGTTIDPSPWWVTSELAKARG